MTITLISAANMFSGGSPALAGDDVPVAETGDFSGLFARMLSGAGEENARADILDTTAILPEVARAALRMRRRGDAETETDNAGVVLLGALSPDGIAPAIPAADTLSAETRGVPFTAFRGAPEVSACVDDPRAEAQNASSGGDADEDDARTANFAVELEGFPDRSGKTAASVATPATMLSSTQESHAIAPAAIAAASSLAARAENPGNPVVDRLGTPLFDPRWAQEFGEKIVWMAKNELQQAQLHLHPAHLGALRINLSLDAEKTSATITAVAATPEARQAIEDALPRLREMLSGAGISLGDAQVGTQSRQESAFATQYGGARPADVRHNGNTAILDHISDAVSAPGFRRGDGLVDLFA
ncbi:MAG: flagellar hook-length control protein FliK [Zoogloeaceae bacterium]|jgi:flagellar hook-length control protein FliK|nr:flagellar hook-length control protein FliK [Zoogloeaceae bacterium]